MCAKPLTIDWYSGRSLPLPAHSVVVTLNCVTCLPSLGRASLCRA